MSLYIYYKIFHIIFHILYIKIHILYICIFAFKLFPHSFFRIETDSPGCRHYNYYYRWTKPLITLLLLVAKAAPGIIPTQTPNTFIAIAQSKAELA